MCGKNSTNVDSIVADKALVAIGVQGSFEGLFDQSLGVKLKGGHIEADRSSYQTSVAGIYAVGDVIGPPYLAHVASEEAVVCVERMGGLNPNGIDYDSIPACTYCVPQVASLGWTEQTCRAKGMQQGQDYRIGKFPLQASGKAAALGHTEGFVKLIVATKTLRLLGVHMVGCQVTELLAELGLAKALDVGVDDIIGTIHAHPTLSEAVREAALGAVERMVHF